MTTIFWNHVSQLLPRRPWRVLAIYRAKSGTRRIVTCRYSGGAWRFMEPCDKAKLPSRITHWARFPTIPADPCHPKEPLK